MKSTKPFVETLPLLMQVEGVSERGLTKRIQDRGHDRSHATLHRVYKGTTPVILISEEEQGRKPATLEAIASALHVGPETFAEYRLWNMRCRFNPKAVGWPAAIRDLQAMERAAGKAPLDPADLLDETPAKGAPSGSRATGT